MRPLNVFASVIAVLAVAALVGCQSRHREGVKSNLRTQWTDVAANTEDTTEAAEAVLNDEGLKNVTAKSTKVDGMAKGKMADGTEVTVSVERKGESASQVSVNVGMMGSPKLGADLASKIKTRAEGGGRSR